MQQVSRDQRQNHLSKGGDFGFKARMFPLLGAVIGFITIVWTYYVAVTNDPPDVDPFPQSDITHTAIHFPQYRIFRIGLLACCPIFSISFQILKNYLIMTSFELKGCSELNIGYWGWLSSICGFSLALSTATISDGDDMNWTLHTIGASSFFILALFMILKASAIYRDLWGYDKFCPYWSFIWKMYCNQIILGLIIIQIFQWLNVYDLGSLVEWLATFFIMIYFFTLYWDFKNIDIMLHPN